MACPPRDSGGGGVRFSYGNEGIYRKRLLLHDRNYGNCETTPPGNADKAFPPAGSRTRSYHTIPLTSPVCWTHFLFAPLIISAIPDTLSGSAPLKHWQNP